MEDLQKIIDQYVQSEEGAELILGVNNVLGALADFVYDPHSKIVAYQLLDSPTNMGYNGTHAFDLQDHIVQKGKDKNRLVFRDTDGQIYILRPAQSPLAIHALANYPLSEEDKHTIRIILSGQARNA